MSGPPALLECEWPALPVRPALAHGAVHLVAARLPHPVTCGEDRWALLGEAEKRRARRLRLDDHRNRWVAGRSLLKELLARYVGCAAGEVRLRVGPVGKPYLDSPAGCDLQFNYTDSHGCLLYAFTRGAEIGVDLEKLPRPTRYAALARRKLSAVEQAAFSRVPEHAREATFLAGWTRKEAYGKALGVGVRYPMPEVTLCEDFAEARYVVREADREPHALVQLAPPFPGVACVAVAAESFGLETYRIDVGRVFNA